MPAKMKFILCICVLAILTTTTTLKQCFQCSMIFFFIILSSNWVEPKYRQIDGALCIQNQFKSIQMPNSNSTKTHNSNSQHFAIVYFHPFSLIDSGVCRIYWHFGQPWFTFSNNDFSWSHGAGIFFLDSKWFLVHLHYGLQSTKLDRWPRTYRVTM